MSEISNDCILNLVKCGGNVEQLSLNQCANISQSGLLSLHFTESTYSEKALYF